MLGSLRRLTLLRPSGVRMMSGHSMEHAIGALRSLPRPSPPLAARGQLGATSCRLSPNLECGAK